MEFLVSELRVKPQGPEACPEAGLVSSPARLAGPQRSQRSPHVICTCMLIPTIVSNASSINRHVRKYKLPINRLDCTFWAKTVLQFSASSDLILKKLDFEENRRLIVAKNQPFSDI
jgi:hypothetical protein